MTRAQEIAYDLLVVAQKDRLGAARALRRAERLALRIPPRDARGALLALAQVNMRGGPRHRVEECWR